MSFRRPLGLALVFSALLSAGAKSGDAPEEIPEIREDVFNLELFAKFLEPGWQKTTDRRGDEINFSPVEWIAPSYGVSRAEMWGVGAEVTFETDETRKNLAAMRIEPIVRNKEESPWNLWRHRHGYQFFSGKGYFYNTLADERPMMDPTLGAFYDRVLRNVWGYWVKKRLADYLATGDTQKGADWSSVPRSAKPHWKMEKPLKLRYSEEGLHGSTPVLFQINLWHVPVKIDFEVTRSTAPAPQNAYVFLPRGYRWKYDMGEWRRRHGYRKTFIGGYEWEPGFPDGQPLTEKEGQMLDALMEKTVEGWVDMAMAQVVYDLNRKVGEAVRNFSSPKTISDE